MAKVGQPLAVQVLDFTDDPVLQQRWLETYRDHNHRHHDEAVSAFPGVRECLQELHGQGLKLGVVTSKLHALAWHGLEICGLAPFLDCCIGADDCDESKPSPKPVRFGLEALGLSADRCPYVGDSPFDMQAGAGAGCPTVAVTWGMFDEAVLVAQDPTIMCATPQEVARFALG